MTRPCGPLLAAAHRRVVQRDRPQLLRRNAELRAKLTSSQQAVTFQEAFQQSSDTRQGRDLPSQHLARGGSSTPLAPAAAAAVVLAHGQAGDSKLATSAAVISAPARSTSSELNAKKSVPQTEVNHSV
jgi:hypothetical protein